MKRLVMLLLICIVLTRGFAQIVPNATPAVRYITRAEYFFESDPGLGNGTPIANFAAADTVQFTVNISTANLAPGFHILQMRVRDTTGIWGLSEKRYFYNGTDSTTNTTNIVAAEYFIDADPGPGKGIATSVGTTAPVVNFTALIPTNLSPGFHLLAIRAMDANGKWGFLETRNFYLTPTPDPNLPQITSAEYFYDNDPGVGNATRLTVTAGDVITPTFMISVPAAMSTGNHWLAIRVRDQAGHWSLFEKDTVNVGVGLASITCPHDTTVTAAAGQCTATVNNIDPTVTPSGSAVTYALSGATSGSGNGTASGQVFNTGITTVTYALSNSPGTTCSFKVTVNANVVPSVGISASSPAICPGQAVTFTATPVNGGTPTYQWKLNGNNVGTNSSTYLNSSLSNNDVVTLAMMSSLGCANPVTVTSNAITMSVGNQVTPSVTISASSTNICSGTQVTFTATAFGGGATPSYQWRLNGSIVGTNNPTYQSSSLANSDSIQVVMTSSMTCVTQSTAVSNTIKITVGQTAVASVNVAASQTTICSGTEVTFTATPTNGGNAPSYQWKLNGNNVGINAAIYQNPTLQDGDSVRVMMTSSLGCVSQPTVPSNKVAMSVGQSVTPSVSITASATNICPGSLVTFTAAPTNGGDPHYQWRINGNSVGNDSPTYQSSTLQNGDSIVVYMSSSLTCATQQLVLSNTVFIAVSQSVTPSVSITASATSICAGQQATFTATPVNGGANPVYEWTLNNNAVGTSINTYQNSSLKNGDVVRVTMQSTLGCASQGPVYSNSIIMNVGSTVGPSVSITTPSASICSGTQATFTATATNGGPTPTYQWKVNGNNVGTNSNTYQNSSLQNGDSVSVYLTTSLACANPKSVHSNTIAIEVGTPSIYYADVDGDGYGNPASTVQACAAPIGYVSNNGDCDDSNATIHPGTAEVCGNGIDDNCNGLVDENCDTSVTLPVLTLRTYPVKEGNSGLTLLNIDVTLDKPAPLPVSVHWATSNEDALAGIDYVAASGTLNIPVGSSSGTIQVKIIGDLLKEGNERFDVNFSNPVNVALPSDPWSRIMIIDDDHGKINNTSLTIPTVARRNQVWTIPEIGFYQNELVLTDAQGQVVSNVVNYQNNRPIPNVAVGLYFYRIRVMDGQGQVRYYSGRLMITE